MQKIKIIYYNGREIEAEIDLSQLEEKNPARKRAKKYFKYFYINSYFKITNRVEISDWIDDILFKIGNYFLTREEAEKEAKKRYEYAKALQKIKDYIVENGLSFDPDWEDLTQEKFVISYSYLKVFIGYGFFNDCFECVEVKYYKQFSPFGYLKSKEDAEKLIKDCDKELRIIFEIK